MAFCGEIEPFHPQTVVFYIDTAYHLVRSDKAKLNNGQAAQVACWSAGCEVKHELLTREV